MRTSWTVLPVDNRWTAAVLGLPARTRRPLRSGTSGEASHWSTLGDSLFPWEYPGSTLGVPFGVLIRCSTGPLSVPDFPLPSTGCLYSLPSSVRISSKRPHERRSALDRTRKCCIVGCLHRRESSPARPDYAPFKHKVPILLAAAATPDDGCRSHGRRTGSRGRRCGDTDLHQGSAQLRTSLWHRRPGSGRALGSTNSHHAERGKQNARIRP